MNDSCHGRRYNVRSPSTGQVCCFETFDHYVRLSTLENGIHSDALQWIQSYLGERPQYVSVERFTSQIPLSFGVSQSSVLGPVLLVLCTIPHSILIKQNAVDHYLFADSTQLQQACKPPYTRVDISRMYHWHQSMNGTEHFEIKR